MSAAGKVPGERPETTGPSARGWRRIGIALGGDVLVARWKEGETVAEVVVPVRLPAGREDPASALAAAFGTLRERVGVRARVSLALLPPLCEVRLVALPPVRVHEAEAVLRRDRARHFLHASVPAVVGVLAAPRARAAGRGEETGPSPLPVLAASAPRALAEALHGAVFSQGWRLDRIVPGQTAWIAALDAAGRSVPAAVGVRAVVAVLGETAHVARVDGGAPDRIRRLPVASLADVVAAAGPLPGAVLVLDGEGKDAPLTGAFRAAGWAVAQRPSGSADPARAAADHAAVAGAELVPPSLELARRDRSRTVGRRMGVAAVLLIVAAAALGIWDAGRDLRELRAERAALRPSVEPALAAREELETLESRLASIGAIQTGSAGWTFALVELSVLLPEDVHLVAIQAAGDTVVVEASGFRAGDALDALRRASSFGDVRLEGSIQRDLQAGTTGRERFTLSAVRRPWTAAPDRGTDGLPFSGDDR